MDPFSIGELSIAVVSVLGALGLCLRGSRCTSISTPCCSIERSVKDVDEEEDENINNP